MGVWGWGALGRAESGITSPPGGENRQNIKEEIILRCSGGTSKSLNVPLFYPNCKTLNTFYGRSNDLKGGKRKPKYIRFDQPKHKNTQKHQQLLCTSAHAPIKLTSVKLAWQLGHKWIRKLYCAAGIFLPLKGFTATTLHCTRHNKSKQ